MTLNSLKEEDEIFFVSEEVLADRALVRARNNAYARGVEPDSNELPRLPDVSPAFSAGVPKRRRGFFRSYIDLMMGKPI